MGKSLKKLTVCLMTGMMIAAVAGSSTTFAKEKSGTQVKASSDNKIPIKAKDRVSVHDPSIVKSGVHIMYSVLI